MRGQKRDAVIRSYVKFGNDIDAERDKTKSIVSSSRRGGHFARKRVMFSDNQYNFNMFIGDSKTPLGEFTMTFIQASRKNKSWRNKLFNSTDDSYRLRYLAMTPASREQWKIDTYAMLLKIRDERCDHTN